MLALWHMDLITMRMSPVVVRAERNPQPTVEGRDVGPVKLDVTFLTEAPVSEGEKRHVADSRFAVYFDKQGKLSLIIRPDGLVKAVLTADEFKDWRGNWPLLPQK